ncbi:hypothetical protein M404DRAFT_1003036 [Pisolithus tinctorius Marx 270]|uniref:Secreted protein n=1 Tax=Pisolithus tinctorius Marx 270 TaxID=870435 RepID=A0A0C3JW14_PISTI|nr:hypothetical protein M404DRAFT_1003036 [Pisolithus tinctorius Marx 270]
MAWFLFLVYVCGFPTICHDLVLIPQLLSLEGLPSPSPRQYLTGAYAIARPFRCPTSRFFRLWYYSTRPSEWYIFYVFYFCCFAF